MTNPSSPKVSIGVPVYNGAKTLPTMLDCLLAQTFGDFEIFISDNASTDQTEAICKAYAARDSRIRYFRQPKNLGAEGNFRFVLDEARAPYFMWSATDDTRSPEYLEENVSFLDTHPTYVASTCPNRMANTTVPVTFAIEGTPAERFDAFLDNCWISHGIFYGVIRTAALKDCDLIGQFFFGFDWAVDLHMASRGNIHRTEKGLMVSGVSGISSNTKVFRHYRTHKIGWIVPFHRVSAYAWELSAGWPLSQRLALLKRLVWLNLVTARAQMRAEADIFYRNRVRPWLAAAERQ